MDNISSAPLFETEYGHFSPDGNEYIIKTPRTPKPWVNVISNGDYGIVISQAGGGFSWKTHSEFNRITRWHQDLIRDDWGKYIYIKNNQTGKVWSPTWMPVKQDLSFYECRFGFGYAAFITEFEKINVTLTLFAAKDNAEIWDLSVKNNSEGEVSLSFYNYFEWTLGSSADHHREFHRTFIETKIDTEHNAIIAGKSLWDIPLGDRGHWNTEYPYKGFFACSKKASSFECDKEAFLGQYGSIQYPLAVSIGKLTNTCGKGHDPIASLKIDITLRAGSSERFSYILGLSEDEN
ncbi:MAG: glycosyl transferase family 36, partial [Bacteroidota bacterium]|nr:glycosyl transferase family 36 [Bacteroidota bacterium]